jgi:hypothetical protein
VTTTPPALRILSLGDDCSGTDVISGTEILDGPPQPDNVQFTGLASIDWSRPVIQYHPPIPGTASRRVDLDRARLRDQVSRLLSLSASTA